jgi:DNA-directed RNA polymerase specialized sigma24 family protein
MEAEESKGSVTDLIRRLDDGDDRAVQVLCQRYFESVVRWARDRLGGAPRAAADEEDVALSAFKSFYVAVEGGRFPQLDDRHHLWRILAAIADRKAVDHRRFQGRVKRGGGQVRNEADLVGGDAVVNVLAQKPDRGPSPEEFTALMDDLPARLDDLLTRLGDDGYTDKEIETLRRIAIRKIGGYTDKEIATQLECGLRTVERKWGVIRSKLMGDLCACLGDESLRRIAMLKMEGYTDKEIATQLRCPEQAVERKLRVILSTWLADEPS